AGPAETAGGSTGAATCGGPGTVQASPGTVQTGPVPAGSTSTAPRPMQVDAAVDPDRRTDAGRVASYIAKYATKSTGVTDGVDRRVTTFDDIEATGANRHAKAMMRTALQLAEVPHLAHLRLDQWAHML